MDERLKFVARLLEGEQMAGLSREYGIPRKTGYKIWNRYRDYGLDGLTDHSRGACWVRYRLETEASGLEISRKTALKFSFALMVGVLLAIAAVDVHRWLA